MKDNTKVRLHLSKKLFESLTREIIKEAKANDGYSVAVKQPKAPKQSKSQATSPEVQKTDAEAMMGEMEMNVAEKKQKVDEFVGTETADSGMITALATLLGIGVPLATGLIKHLRQAKTPEEKKQVIQKDLSKTEGGALNENEILTQLQNFLTTQIGSGGDAASVGSILAGLASIGVSAAAIDKLHQWWQKKHPESYKKAQSLSGAMDRSVGGNEPGQGHGVKTGKFESTLKEYEHHYRMVNGQCRRYNDEGEYEVVASHHCR